MSITVYAPASIGNVNVGFDVLGAAIKPIDNSLLGDRVKISFQNDNAFFVSGPFANKLPEKFSENIVWHCMNSFNSQLERRDIATKNIRLELEKNLPIGSGLGSSASSIVAAFVALNQIYDKPFKEEQLLVLMGEMEAKIAGSLHYDNIAPCFLGGMQLMLKNSTTVSRALPMFDDWFFVMAYSGINISTKESRDLLPDSFSRQDIISHSQQLANFVDALYRRDERQALDHMQDIIAEPVRQSQLPNFSYVKDNAFDKGSQIVGISGSGPTIFSICLDIESANKVAKYFSEYYLQNDQGFVRICQIDREGATYTSESEL